MIGIEAINFYVPRYYLDSKILAESRGIDYEKYKIGLGIEKIAIPAPNEDIITMGANAAEPLISEGISMVIFATESSIDQSKAAGLFLSEMLKLPKNCRFVEIKQACYSATAALFFAINLVKAEESSKVLIIASDYAKYDLCSSGEPTQGAGAVAMLISNNAKVITFDQKTGYYASNIDDFWRPNFRETPCVDGKLSTQSYLKFLKETIKHLNAPFNASYYCYHTPFPKMAFKAHQIVNPSTNFDEVKNSIYYSSQIGNCYTASLYLCLISLLSLDNPNGGDRVFFYSYGSGAVAECFLGTIINSYKDYIPNQDIISNRTAIDFETYEMWWKQLDHNINYDSGNFRLIQKGVKRVYEW